MPSPPTSSTCLRMIPWRARVWRILVRLWPKPISRSLPFLDPLQEAGDGPSVRAYPWSIFNTAPRSHRAADHRVRRHRGSRRKQVGQGRADVTCRRRGVLRSWSAWRIEEDVGAFSILPGRARTLKQAILKSMERKLPRVRGICPDTRTAGLWVAIGGAARLLAIIRTAGGCLCSSLCPPPPGRTCSSPHARQQPPIGLASWREAPP